MNMKKLGTAVLLVGILAVIVAAGIYFVGMSKKTSTVPPVEVVGIADTLIVTEPKPNEVISSPLTIKGQARGSFYFEASFPIHLLDANHNLIASVPAQAQGDWMTTGFVPFEATLTFEKPATATGFLIFENDNPSGNPETSVKFEMPVNF